MRHDDTRNPSQIYKRQALTTDMTIYNVECISRPNTQDGQLG